MLTQSTTAVLFILFILCKQNHKDDEELSHGASWRHIVHMDHQDQAKEQALRLHEAEEILIEQGEDFIRYKVILECMI